MLVLFLPTLNMCLCVMVWIWSKAKSQFVLFRPALNEIEQQPENPASSLQIFLVVVCLLYDSFIEKTARRQSENGLTSTMKSRSVTISHLQTRIHVPSTTTLIMIFNRPRFHFWPMFDNAQFFFLFYHSVKDKMFSCVRIN